MNPQDPKCIGFWTKCIRETSHWSQEALAASAGLDVRTIQRIEAGQPVSITTPNIFDDPGFIKDL